MLIHSHHRVVQTGRFASVALLLGLACLAGCDRNDPARPQAEAAARATEDAAKHAAAAARTESQELEAKAKDSKALEKTGQAIDSAGNRAKAALDGLADRTRHTDEGSGDSKASPQK